MTDQRTGVSMAASGQQNPDGLMASARTDQLRATPTMIDERTIQEWQRTRWPATWAEGDIRVHAAKLAEETGEVCGAAIKVAEGRKPEHALADELGDVLIVAAVLAADIGMTLQELQAQRWAEVSTR